MLIRKLKYPIYINKTLRFFPDLICAVYLDTSHKFVAAALGKPLVLRLHGDF